MKTLRTKKTLTAVILFLMIFFTYSVYASPPENQSHFSPSRHLINIINFFIDLELTREQKDALQELLTDTHNEIKPLVEEMHALRTEMDELLLAEEIDALNAKLQGAQILTPEQRESILMQKAEWKERFLYWRNAFSKLFFN
jgi:Spy/CpxP family protein refolding chaperone